MKLTIEFDLQNDATIVHWPWGKQAFPFGSVGTADLAEALKNFAIFSTKRGINPSKTPYVSADDLRAIREAMEHGGFRPKYDEKGKAIVPSLDELFGEDEFFGESHAAE